MPSASLRRLVETTAPAATSWIRVAVGIVFDARVAARLPGVPGE